MKKIVKDNDSRCKVCGCILGKYHAGSIQICECCKDDLDESNPYNAWERGVDIGDD